MGFSFTTRMTRPPSAAHTLAGDFCSSDLAWQSARRPFSHCHRCWRHCRRFLLRRLAATPF
eukprot:969796-Alexandrium_andersonii.AAC.1